MTSEFMDKPREAIVQGTPALLGGDDLDHFFASPLDLINSELWTMSLSLLLRQRLLLKNHCDRSFT